LLHVTITSESSVIKVTECPVFKRQLFNRKRFSL